MQLISRDKILSLNDPKIMGILNVTPDSFSDGGRFQTLDAALRQAENMLHAGATLIDVGGESTRPDASPVSLEEELDRVIPVIEALRQRFDCWISIDTSKAQVMTEAVNAGADLINDVFALRQDGALKAASVANVPVCLMHMQGTPKTMQKAPMYDNVIDGVTMFFTERLQQCEEFGIKRQNIVLDPGFGFGKTLAHNYQLLANLDKLQAFSLPILAGISRKSMIYRPLAQLPEQAVIGSVIAATLAVERGANIVRVHDVKETQEALAIHQLIKEQQ